MKRYSSRTKELLLLMIFLVAMLGVIAFTTIPEAATSHSFLTGAVIGITSGSPPNATLQNPTNDSHHPVNRTNIILNASVKDPESDLLNVSFFASNTTSFSNGNSLVYRRTSVAGSNFTYNITTLPITPDSSTMLLLHFDNRSGFGESDTLAYDFSNLGNNATCSGTPCPTFVEEGGKFAGAFRYDGSNDFFNASNASSLNSYSDLTVEAWINFTGSAGEAGILEKGNNNQFRLKLTVDDRADFFVSGFGDTATSAPITLNQWTHIVAVYDDTGGGNDIINIYVNGEFADNTSIGFGTPAKTQAPLLIGVKGSLASYFPGSIDEVAIYNRTLSLDEIRAHHRFKRGSYYWKVNATDGTGSNESVIWKFNVGNNPPNVTAPSISPILAYTNSTLLTNTTYNDADGDNGTVYFQWYVDFVNIYNQTDVNVAPNTTLFATLDGGNFSKGDFVYVSIYANDGANDSVTVISSTLVIVDTPPEVASANITSSDARNLTNGTLTGVWYTADNDGDALTLNETKWFNNSIEVVALANKTEVGAGNTTKKENWTFSVRSFDGNSWSNWINSSNFTIRNAIPEFNQSLTSQTARSNTLFTYQINASDLDGDLINYSDNTTLFDINLTTGFINFTPSEAQIGTYSINITISDGEGNTSHNFTLTVLDGTSPAFSNASNTSLNFRRYQNFTANITITDGVGLSTYIFSTNASGSWINTTPASLAGVNYSNVSTSANITLAKNNIICWFYWTNDTSGNNGTSSTFCFTVQNTPPEVVSANITSSDARNLTNGTLTGVWYTADNDGDALTLNETKWFNNSIEVVTLANKTEVGAGNTTKAQNWVFSVRSFDGNSWSNWINSSNFTIRNTPPAFASNLTNQSITVGNSLSYTINCTDIDNDTLTYTDNTSLFNINSSTGVIEDTPVAAEVGVYAINITCNDGEQNVSQAFTYTITAATEQPSGGGGGGGGRASARAPICTSNDNCKEGYFCKDNSCVPYQCTQDTQCARDEFCVNYECLKLFDLKILHADSPLQPGQDFDFIYFIKSVSKISGDVTFDFRIERPGKVIASGSDIIFVGDYEEKTEKGRLYLPANIPSGTYTFFITLTFNRYTVTSYRTIEIRQEVLPEVDLILLGPLAPMENTPWNYSFLITSNQDKILTIPVSRAISRAGQTQWSSVDQISVDRSALITDSVPALPAGAYQWEGFATVGEKIIITEKKFAINPLLGGAEEAAGTNVISNKILPLAGKAFYGAWDGSTSSRWILVTLFGVFMLLGLLYLISTKYRSTPPSLLHLERIIRRMITEHMPEERMQYLLAHQSRWSGEQIAAVLEHLKAEARLREAHILQDQHITELRRYIAALAKANQSSGIILENLTQKGWRRELLEPYLDSFFHIHFPHLKR